MRKLFSINTAIGFKGQVFFNPELSEYIVRFYSGKEHLEQLDYFTNCANDALETMRVQIECLKCDEVLTD